MALLVLALCAAVVASGTPAALAAKPGSQPNALVFSQFELRGTNGYTVEGIEVEKGDFPPSTVIVAERDGLRASYEVPGELEPGMKAVFGTLGRVALDFHRKTRSVDRPEKGCTYITETGVLRGEFSFVGEGGYTAADATSVTGEVLRLPNGCGFGDRIGLPIPDSLRSTQVAARSRVPHGFVQFEATAQGRGSKFGFEALLREAIGAMTISRTASANAASGLGFAPGKQPRRAGVDPPPPFEGSARFRHPAGGDPTWTGSLSVSLPGAADIALAGRGFTARLCPHLGILSRCKVTLPPQDARRAAVGNWQGRQ
jgi:hypothetical protein